MICPERSGEQIDAQEYRKAALLLSLPPGLLLARYLEHVSRTVRGVSGQGPLWNTPADCILYGLHSDYFPFYAFVLNYWEGALPIWIGYHGFLSYLAYGTAHRNHLPMIRYSPGSPIRPMDQLLASMSRSPDRRFGIGADPGGPYGKVRPSLARLAVRSGRPLVPVRCRATRRLHLGTQWPLPGTEIAISVGEPLVAERLEALAPGPCLALLQTSIDRL